MKLATVRLPVIAAFLALAPLARAHPGHDEPDFTWEFSHLVDHPLATLLCLAVLGMAVALGLRHARRRAAQQPSRRS